MDYKPPAILFNKHLETVYPALLRRVDLIPYTRERITTDDNDFLDLDWLTTDSTDLIIISHGLEGNSTRAYVRGIARAAWQNKFNVLAWNFRGCSGEINKQLRFYHSGATDDLQTVIEHAISKQRYNRIFLLGFSLGGNLTLKYLGEDRMLAAEISKAVVFSVPMDLESSCEKISSASNWIYALRFLKSLKAKVIAKARFNKELDIQGIGKIKTLTEFDDRYTAPIHGFEDAHDYYQRSSSIRFVNHIKIPTLIVNALNDPFLSDTCYPVTKLQGHPFVQLEVPARGGHVGFTQFNKNGLYWSEQRAIDFFSYES